MCSGDSALQQWVQIRATAPQFWHDASKIVTTNNLTLLRPSKRLRNRNLLAV